MEKKIKKTRHRKYDAQFKQEALKQVENGQTVGSVAQALGISEALLYSWRKRLTVSLISPNTEVDQLRKQIKQLEMERDILKKSFNHFQPLTMRELYQFICDQRKHFPIGELCKAVGVNRSCYYEYRNGITYANRSSDQQLAKEVNELFCFHRRRYGSRRITKALQYKGVRIGRFKVRRLLRDQSLKAIQPKSFVPKTTDSNHQLGYAPNVVAALDFPSQPDEVYVGDITYLPASNGQWFYLNVWIDLFSRRVVGWKVDTHMEENLVVDSLTQALGKRNPAVGLIVHSDCGGQYAANRFKEVLKNYRCIQSMSGADNPYDNAYAESFFSRFKAELLEKGVFESIQDATTEIFNYIEMYYNTQRLHSSLNYLSPLQYEERFHESEKEALTVC